MDLLPDVVGYGVRTRGGGARGFGQRAGDFLLPEGELVRVTGRLTSARVGGGGAGKKWSRRAVLIPSGVSLCGKEGNQGCCRTQASFLASQREDGERVER